MSNGWRSSFVLVALSRHAKPIQVPDLTPDQLLLSLGLRSIMRERGLDPQEDVALKQALPSFLRHASVVRVGKAQVGKAMQGLAGGGNGRC